MEWVIPYFIFALSLDPLYIDPYGAGHQNAGMTNIVIGAEILDYLYIEGEIVTKIIYVNLFEQSPYQDEYYIRAYMELGRWTIGAEHVCYHPVISAYEHNIPQYTGGYNRFYLQFDTRSK